MKTFLKFVITFIILILVFNLVLLIGSSFPSSCIENNVKTSSKILENEGNLPSLCNVTYNDNYTDAVMINTCYSIDNSDPFFSYLSRKKKL